MAITEGEQAMLDELKKIKKLIRSFHCNPEIVADEELAKQ